MLSIIYSCTPTRSWSSKSVAEAQRETLRTQSFAHRQPTPLAHGVTMQPHAFVALAEHPVVEFHTSGLPEERTARYLFVAQRKSIAQARVDIGFQPRGQRQQKAYYRVDRQRIGLCIGLCHIARTGIDKKEVAQLHTACELHVVLVGCGVAHFGVGDPIGQGDKRRKTAKVHHIEHLCCLLYTSPSPRDRG